MNILFHFPPELLNLLIDTLLKLCKSKQDLLLFFQGETTSEKLLEPYRILLRKNKVNFNQYHVTCELLTKLNELGNGNLRERREILKRGTEFNDFSVCWRFDQAHERGLVAQIRELVWEK